MIDTLNFVAQHLPSSFNSLMTVFLCYFVFKIDRRLFEIEIVVKREGKVK